MTSFEELAQQYTPMIYKIMGSLSIHRNKDEFFQVGLIGLWEAYGRFDSEKGSFLNYAYTCIKGKLLSEMTRMNKESERAISMNEEFWEYIEDQTHFNPLEKDILQSYCHTGRLSDRETKWVLYTFLHQLTIHEIARIEGVSTSAVKNWRAGAKEKLRTNILHQLEL